MDPQFGRNQVNEIFILGIVSQSPDLIRSENIQNQDTNVEGSTNRAGGMKQILEAEDNSVCAKPLVARDRAKS
jgi:hypothetical protein